MSDIIKRIAEWIKSFWTRKPAPKKVTRQIRQKEHYGAHYYLGDLLDNLNSCVDEFRLLEKSDADAFSLYRQLGASVASSDFRHPMAQIEPHIISGGLPSFSAIFIGRDSPQADLDTLSMKFIYAMKQKRCPNVQGTNKIMYKVGVIYKDLRYKKPLHAEVYLAVGDDGSIEPLKICYPKTFRTGKGAPIVRMSWVYPEILQMIASDELTSFEAGDISAVAKNLLTNALNGYAALDSGFMVRAKKGKLTAAFAIDMLRSPYFFADRIKVKNENGRTKHIFHYVKGYKKMNGKFIKPHFRGLRKFHWNGFDVSVSMPGKQHVAIGDATFSGVDELDMKDGRKYLNMGEAGRKISERMEA